MRLHSLAITAVGPFATTEEIDFDRLTRGGLFLLEGPTGAGKSTVLDAITFALFGAPAGETTSSDRMHSHFAAPATTPEVVLEFSVRGDRLRITRSPEHERPKLRGEGFTTEKSSVHLQRSVDGSWTTLGVSAQEVGAEIQRTLGLNREQFTKVVLLPQGEFATFLRAKDDVRRSVLSQIFGTAFYDDVTKQLEIWRRDAGRERGAADDEVTKALAALGAASGLDEDAREALHASGGEGEHLDALAERLAENHRLAADAEAAERRIRDNAETEQQRLADLDQAHRDHAGYLRRRAAHDDAAASHAPRVEELRRARAAEPVNVVLTQLGADVRHADRLRADLIALAPDLTGDETGADASSFEAAAAQGESTATTLAATAALEAGLDARRADLDEQRSLNDEAHKRINEMVARRADLPDLLEKLGAQIDGLSREAGAVTALRTAEQGAQARVSAADKVVTLSGELAAAHTAATDADKVHLEAKRIRLSLLERHLTGIAAELATDLEEGVPCPVCGGTDHPVPAAPLDDHVSREQVDAAEAAESVASERLNQARERVSELDSELAGFVAVAEGLDPQAARAALNELTESLVAARAAETGLLEAQGRERALRKELSGAEQAEARAVADLAARTAEHSLATTRFAHDEATVASARDGHPTVAARIFELQTRAAHARRVASALTALGRARDSLTAKQVEAAGAAARAGFATLDDARAAARDGNVIADLDTLVKEYEQETAKLVEIADDTRFRNLDPEAAPTVADALIRARTAANESQDRLDSAARASTRTEGWLKAYHSNRSALVAQIDKRDRIYADTAPIARMADLTKGHSGAVRMSLSTYVLRHWFASVVDAANLRLDRMSAGRYQLERTDDTERKTDQAGLGLKVIDRHTGEARSPKSLSGGETFYTSLSLALGLADVVIAEAGGVDLDTLFVDEGFGTLDAETLELVMAVIDNLRVDGRGVGIVSHVADLKDQITERLEVRRAHPQGPSTTKVIA